MKKLYTASLLIFLICFSTLSSYAKTVTEAFIDEAGTVNFNVSSDTEKEALITVYITEKDAQISDSTGESDIIGIRGVEQLKLVPDPKKYTQGTLTVKISDLVPGTQYEIIAGGADLNGEKISVIYPVDFDAAIAELKNSDEQTVCSVLEKWQNRAWILDFENADFVFNKEKSSENLACITESLTDLKSVYTGFTNSHQLALLSECDKEEVYEILLKNEYNFAVEYSEYILSENTAVLDAFINLRVDAALNPLRNTEELKTVLRRAEALGVLNGSTRADVLDILKSYNDVFGLDFDGDYLKADSYEVAKQMVPNDNPYTSIKSVSDNFKKATASSDDDSTSSGGGKSGGTSSGGGVSGGFVSSDIISSVSPVQGFEDINEAEWASVYIRYMQDRNILSGDGNGRVRPNDAVTREEFVKIIIEALKPSVTESLQAENTFADVSEDAWYSKYVSDACALGIVNGMGDGLFGTGEKITRQDAAVMIHRTSEIMKLVLKNNRDEIEFADKDAISDYALSAVKALSMSEIISGYEDGSFLPKNSVTRAETAKLVYSLLKHTNRL